MPPSNRRETLPALLEAIGITVAVREKVLAGVKGEAIDKTLPLPFLLLLSGDQSPNRRWKNRNQRQKKWRWKRVGKRLLKKPLAKSVKILLRLLS
jgi:hypothetical protein